ncbi:mycofactocin oligosaccharide methyltransferase MftM [Nocardia pneumoniae]|uniref:mycofactocin oligosaccharide methyltransferase MftM n=1 Tax=Nocardia pneumoniae TaxID=228601 RepID=UPI0002EB1ABB|nr:mycofactocin oligosaccharide methyltransferase MftM [Nocardia pneumoniae]
MTGTEVAAAVDPLAPLCDGFYDDGVVRVGGVRDGSTRLRTTHFHVRLADNRIVVGHRLTRHDLDNDVTGMIADELFRSGPLTGTELFERVLTGVVRTTVAEPLTAWNTFYDNTLAKIRALWTMTPEPGTPIADMAPVYRRALAFVPPGRVLDLGSCFGFFPLLLAEGGRHDAIATDLVRGSMALLSRIARLRGTALDTLACDAVSVPLPDDCVRTVTVLHLLEHLDPVQARAVIAEAVRVAGERVVVAVPFEQEPDATYGHVRTFDLAELAVLGVETGLPFTVSEHHGGWLVLDTR